jgi:hypothetical protein
VVSLAQENHAGLKKRPPLLKPVFFAGMRVLIDLCGMAERNFIHKFVPKNHSLSGLRVQTI